MADGWLPTGDAGSLDGQGRLTVFGRRGDMITTGGEKVWPHAVEEVLALHQDVAEVAVVGRPDPEWGQRVVAWVVPVDVSRPPTLSALRAFVADQLPSYAAPAPVGAGGLAAAHRLGKARPPPSPRLQRVAFEERQVGYDGADVQHPVIGDQGFVRHVAVEQCCCCQSARKW